MIKLTRLNGSTMVINALLIERVESTPDTVVRLTTGSQYVVRDTCDEVCVKTAQFFREIGAGHIDLPAIIRQ
ncbi:MAG: flagellar FlbD family protein [Armatimonadetes bacterium]|jgi:flagellar protein FlbD|nr:flagellar FlbD family protein [Armatimonadota bacterium]MDI9584324.1 flagellar FlbD family protein [Acidobacteriota bacterium]